MSRLVVTIGHVEFTGDSQVLYVVKVQQDLDQWEVRRTYSEFRKLRDDIQRIMKDERVYIVDDTFSHEFIRELQDVTFPAKRLFGSKKDHVVKYRARELHRFLLKLLALTHTYRKAQKARYDQSIQALPVQQQAAYAALQERTQASIAVFYVLRDFLKPMKTDSPSHSSDLIASSRRGKNQTGVAGEASEDVSIRLIRESNILSMRTSNASERRNLSYIEDEKMQQHKHKDNQAEELRKEQQQRHQTQQIIRALSVERKNEASNSANNNCGSVTSQNGRGISRYNSKTSKIIETSSQRSGTHATSLCGQPVQKTHSNSALPKEHRKERHNSTRDSNKVIWKQRSARAGTSMLTHNPVTSSPGDGSEPEKESMITSSSMSSLASSASADEVKLVDLSSLMQYKTKKSSKRGSLSSDKTHSFQKSWSTEKSTTSRSREDKRSLRTKRKAKSAKNIPMSDSERMSRVSSAVNAQTSINAQRELEKYLSEYSAIMILRYVNRFINKAVMRGPGCYHVNAQQQLVIDCKRFLEELELTFTDLPKNFGELFHIGAPGDQDEWGLPPALNKYVQLKWESFQAMSSNNISHNNGHSSISDFTSDSNDSDTDYDYEEVSGGGYMTAKHTFSNGEESMLQEMIANGTAGREQMLRLRRQVNEQGWNWRENPGSRSQRLIEEASSSDTDREESIAQQREKRSVKRRDSKRSVPCDVERYQQEQNARRKDRLSRVQSIGGFV
ncbi:unnamed protein product [Peronospora belbahrii]|uniref:PX domain-containing protein n=1 Tax=Peronospora belbahrii TaxID=622444 RepID=A0AAU9LC33_9STRA|nr:unnamed protein product [Peronospora belbahrii]CAH0516906.1 unnamed protein product [Peronospora belbahrii]